MVEKTLSAGTLNLRFMQNARRALQHPRVQPEQPHVKDDAEWEVSSEIREAWGPDAYRGEKAVTYETSYLPFLFPSLHDTPAADGPSRSLSPSNTLRPRGRRVFNKRGEEVTPTSNSKVDATPPEHVGQQASEQTKSTKNAVRDTCEDVVDVDVDIARTGLRQSSSMQGTSFLRPSGVDGPADLIKASDSAKKGTQSSGGATNSSKEKVKRSRTSGEVNKTQKKMRPALIE